jgi:NADPH-dependent curcumin reductase CurA
MTPIRTTVDFDRSPRGQKLTGEECRWHEAPIPRPSDGQVLIRTLWLSVDPRSGSGWRAIPTSPQFRLVMSCSPLLSGR